MKVVAVNARGFSSYSEEITVHTKVNLKDMPRPLSAQYDHETGRVYFSVDPSTERLLGRVEGRARGQEQWLPLAEVEVDRPQVSLEVANAAALVDIRVLLCLQNNASWCGDERLAEPFDEFSMTTEGSLHPVGAPVTLKAVNVVIIVAVAAGLFFLLVIVFVCCCWKRKASKVNKKDYESEVQNARPKVISGPYYHDDVGKGLDTNVDDMGKHTIYAGSIGSSPHMTNGHGGSQITSNGMLYGSADMLDGVHGGNGSDGAGDLWVKAGQGGEMSTPPETSYQPYDSRLPSGYYYPDDYQGLNEDVMNMKNREHLHSPYYDVSGLPDPYATMGDEDKNPQISLSFDESLESGYSTPNSRNRRIVREIIV